MTASHPYVWRWRRWRPPGYGGYVPHVFADRFGEPCRVLARGRTMNSVAIEFAATGSPRSYRRGRYAARDRRDTARDRAAR